MTTFGAATNLVANTLTLTLPDGAKYWYLQNQSTAPILITFAANSGLGPIVLNPCAIAGATTGWAGDWIDTNNGPPAFSGSIVLTSTVTTAQFGSGYSTVLPVSGISRATTG